MSLLALWGKGYKEPWYIVSSLGADQTELLYRWRMRLEATNRDEKTGVLLRESGDNHALTNSMHFHRLMPALSAAEWLCALTGLQAWNDLPEDPIPSPARVVADFPPRPVHSASLTQEPAVLPTASACDEPATRPGEALPSWVTDPRLQEGPASPPPVIPHRGKAPKLPPWFRPFAARGMPSYVRLGLEVLRCPEPPPILQRLVRWLAAYLWTWVPLWRPHQIRYRLSHWWTYPP